MSRERDFVFNGFLATATLPAAASQPAGPMETIRDGGGGHKILATPDHEGQIGSANSGWEPPLARLAHSWSSKLDEAS